MMQQMSRLASILVCLTLPCCMVDVSLAFSSLSKNASRQPTSTSLPASLQMKNTLVDTKHHPSEEDTSSMTRRDALQVSAGVAAAAMFTFFGTTMSNPQNANAAAAAMQDTLDIDNFLRTGVDAGGNMGVSSQAGKSRPQTGVIFRDGSDVQQDSKGNVVAEILTGTKANPNVILVSFNSPAWKLETGPVFDIETRDVKGKSGDGAFIAVTKDTNGKSISELSNDFFTDRLFDPTGRFSFYGPPTDIKVKKSTIKNDGDTLYRWIEVSFSYLSQSTNAEIPRKALIVATIPKGTNQAIMLVGSATASRWNKDGGSKDQIVATAESFRAIPAPQTGLKVRAKQRGNEFIDF